MAEHEIRLRAAWDGPRSGDEPGPPRRVDLPAPWPPGPTARFVLRRHFHAPRLDPALEGLALRLAGVPGLVRARLNGETLTVAPPIPDPLEIPLPDPLPPRNLLELEVDPAGWHGIPAGGPAAWGHVSLVIRRRDTGRA